MVVANDSDWVTSAQVADLSGIHPGTVRPMLAKLVRDGDLHREKMKRGTRHPIYMYPPAAIQKVKRMRKEQIAENKAKRKEHHWNKVSNAVKEHGAEGAWMMSRKREQEKLAELRATLPSRLTQEPLTDCCGVVNGLIAGRCWCCFRMHRGDRL